MRQESKAEIVDSFIKGLGGNAATVRFERSTDLFTIEVRTKDDQTFIGKGANSHDALHAMLESVCSERGK